MRYHEIIEAEAVAPLTPKQARARAEKQQKVQARIAATKQKAAEKVRDLQGDLPR